MIKNLQINRPVKALLLLTLAFGLSTLNACKKDDSGDDDFTASITATVDGTNKVFNKNVMGATITSDGDQITSIQGTTANGESISIILPGKLTAGKTYLVGAADNDNMSFISYSVDNIPYWSDISVEHPVSVTLTSVSATSVKGTFTGDLLEVAMDENVRTKVITNGKFSVKLSTQNVQ